MTKPAKKIQQSQGTATAKVDTLNSEGTPDAGTPDEETPDAENPDAPEGEVNMGGLYSVQALAMEFRVPSWQLAALLTLMDSEDDEMLSKEDFKQALSHLSHRRMGQ